MAIGNINAAAALLVTTLLIRNVAKYTAPKTPAGPIPIPVPIATRKVAIAFAKPDAVSAVPMPKADAIVMYTSQLTASRHSCCERMPVLTMIIDAIRPKTNKFEIFLSLSAGINSPIVVSASIIMVMSRAHFNLSNRGGLESAKLENMSGISQLDIKTEIIISFLAENYLLFTSLIKAKERWLSAFCAMNVGPASRSNTSPDWSLIFPG